MRQTPDSSGPRSAQALHAAEGRRRRLLLPFTILLLVSLACSIPDFRQMNPVPAGTTPTLVPTLPAGPEGTSTAPDAAAPNKGVQVVQPTAAPNLPPAVVEVEPLPGSELAPGTAPIFYFNQAMERPSVEAAFKAQPDTAGRLEWLNDSTLRFTPDQPASAGKGLSLTINASAKAANGQALTAPVTVRFPSQGPLRLADRLPAPDTKDVNPSSAVVVTFNHPVVALGADPASLPPAFSLDPAVNGRGEWLNTSTYIFYAEPALMGGAHYTVRLNSGLTSTSGTPLASDSSLEWSFSTAAPALLLVKPSTEQPIPLDSPLTLTFNQPMDTASVEGNFSLLGPGGSPVAGKISWNDAATELTFKPNELLQRESSYTVALFAAARSQGGAAFGHDFAASLTTVPQFAVTQTRPAAGENLEGFQGYATVTLTFSAPIAPGQDFNRLVTLNPPVVGMSVTRDYNGYDLYVSGYFKPSTSYALTTTADLRDRWGATLGSPYSFTFTSAPARPTLVIPVRDVGSQVMFVPQNETSLAARGTNITRLSLSRGKLSLAEFIQVNTNGWSGVDWEPKVQASWPVLLYPTKDVSEPVNIPLTQSGGQLDPGLYLFKVDTQPVTDSSPNPAPSLLVVSPIQILLKTSAHQAFAWAVRLSDNSPVEKAAISIYDSSAAVLGSCTTNAQGTCQADLAGRKDFDKPLYAVLGQPGDPDFSLASSDWSQGVTSWEFGVPYFGQNVKPLAYLYTDRPIYRPGQAVNFRVILRAQDNGRYSPPPENQINVEVISAYNQVTGQSQILTTLPLTLDTLGAASGTYTLPDDAISGVYMLRIKEEPSNTLNFQVAEYRKPEIDLQVQFSQPDDLTGKDIQAQVTARYFFGAPAGNLPVHWSLFRSPDFLATSDNLSVGKVDTSWLMPWGSVGGSGIYVMDGQAQMGPDGKLTIPFSGADLRERLGSAASDLQNLAIEVTVEDESGLPVSARGNVRLHPSPYYIGVRPEQWTVQSGQDITYYIRTVDWQSNPIPDKPLTARFLKVVWVQQEVTDPLAPPSYRPEYTEAGSTDFRTSPQGEARLAFTPGEPGTFMIEITGESGAITQALTWVGGAGTAEWPALPNQRLLLRSDAKSYQPGKTAHIFIPNPYPDGALALVTTERGKVMRSFVVPIQGASYEMQLPLTTDDAPNIYVTVTLLGRANNHPDFRVGYLELKVDPSALALQVDVQSSTQQPQPGSEVTLNIRVKDAEGKPVQGEFSLALIDKAVLALAEPNSPSILDAFYGEQPLAVYSSYPLAIYAGRFVYSPPGRGGGGGDEIGPSAPVRTNFADTAYWNGSIQTDVTGVAQVTLTLPDNLTTWRADVRGLTSDTRVGQAQLDLTASKPLLIRPVAPRFVVLGDHLELAAVVNNNTQDALHTSVRLEAAGFTLDEPNQAVQPVDIPAGDRRRVSWWGTVQDVPALDLTFSCEAGDLGDAARTEGGPLPVLRYAAPQTFGTSGVLAEAGERKELVSLPRSFTPTGGELRLELSPSLSATVLDGLKALEAYPHDFTEPILSRLLPNLAANQAFKELHLEGDTLHTSLETAVSASVDRLVRLQNENGGWGWANSYPSDPYISSYVLLGLGRAAQSGVFVDPQVLQKGQAYLASQLLTPAVDTAPWKLDQLAFQFFALQQSGRTDLNLNPLYEYRDKLSPWGKAFLSLVLDAQSPGDARARTLVSDLETSASRSATGANWQDLNPTWHSWSTPSFTTAVVVYAIAHLDPSAQVLTDAVRYLVLNRRPGGAWASSYETAWVLMSLVESARQTGDAQDRFTYSANLNGSPLINGSVQSLAQATNPVNSTVPLANLRADSPNELTIQRAAGSGRLYYRAYLQVDQPAQDAPVIQRGLTITRQYYRSGQDCRKETCQPLDALTLSDPQPVLVRLTLTVPEDMAYVVVEDSIPAGTEVLDTHLKTSQQNVTPSGEPATDQKTQPVDLSNPFGQGWGWWLFKDPQVSDDHVRWVVSDLPAGTYELTYRLTPFLAGEFRVMPAHAWQYYFPETEGASKGSILTIK